VLRPARLCIKFSYCVLDLETSLCSEPAVLLSWFEQNLSTEYGAGFAVLTEEPEACDL
jgi:hypothetical protein